MSDERGYVTPNVRRQLRLLSILAAFVGAIILAAFVLAFRNQGTSVLPANLVRIDTSSVAEGSYSVATVTKNVLIQGQVYDSVPLFVVRTGGQLHALWAKSPQLGCQVQPYTGKTVVHAVFVDPCGGSHFGIDGRCLDGPCPRGLDGFRVLERGGTTYADLGTVVRGTPNQ
jgi:Rieske Fe-S protein